MVAKRGGNAMDVAQRGACEAQVGKDMYDGNGIDNKGDRTQHIYIRRRRRGTRPGEERFLTAKKFGTTEMTDCTEHRDERQNGMQSDLKRIKGNTAPSRMIRTRTRWPARSRSNMLMDEAYMTLGGSGFDLDAVLGDQHPEGPRDSCPLQDERGSNPSRRGSSGPAWRARCSRCTPYWRRSGRLQRAQEDY